MRLKCQRVVLPLALVLLGLPGCAKKGPPGGGAPPAPPPPAVKFVAVERGPVTLYREYTADLKPVRTVDIRTRVGGTLESASFIEGSKVKQGQVLFQIDPAPYYADIQAAESALAKAQVRVTQAQSQVAQAQGALGQTQARLQKAKTQVDLQVSQADLARADSALQAAERELLRLQPLRDNGAIPGQQYDQALDRRNLAQAERDAVAARLTNTKVGDVADLGVAQSDVDAAQANVDSARANVQAAETDVQAARDELDKANLYLSYTSIKAPFDGEIGRLNLNPGTMIVQGNAVLATLSSIDPIYAEFPVSETEYLSLQKGAGFKQADFSLVLANGETHPKQGDFVMLERNIDPQTGTLMVRTRFENPGGILKPGGFGKVTMKMGEIPDALTIPQKAVVSNQSLTSVYVVKDDNTADLRTVELGEALKLGGVVVVQKGLKEGEKVVVDGLQKIRPGATVAPEEAS